MPPFRKIGEEGWVKNLQKLLTEYGIEPSQGLSEKAVEQRERELGLNFPDPLRSFLIEFGHTNLGRFCLYPLYSMALSTDIWFRDFLTSEEQEQLQDLLGIANSGSDNVLAIDPITGYCYICNHDPAGIFLEANSFDEFLQKIIIDLSWGYYGWPDPHVEELALELKLDLFGDRSTNT